MGARGDEPRAALLAKAVAFAADRDDLAMMQQAIQDGRGHDLVSEHLAPVADRLVGGEQYAAALVALGDDLEQQMGGAGRHRQIAELVDHQQVRLGEAAQADVPLVRVVGAHQRGHQRRRRDVAHRVVLVDGGAAEGDGEMGLAHPRRSEQQQVVAVRHPSGGPEIPQLVGVDAGLRLAVGVCQIFRVRT